VQKCGKDFPENQVAVLHFIGLKRCISIDRLHKSS